jgi:transcriptional antiterminator RfaH
LPQPAQACGLLARERWYVVRTLPHCELRAQGQLSAQNFRSFLPRYTKTVRHARKLRSIMAPFFPRYLFVALDLERDRWRSINGTFGVCGLIMTGEAPAPVARGVVESLSASCDANGRVQAGRCLDIGDRVRVLTGPFTDLVGYLVRIDGRERVQVLLRLLGGEVPVSIERTALVPTLSA